MRGSIYRPQPKGACQEEKEKQVRHPSVKQWKETEDHQEGKTAPRWKCGESFPKKKMPGYLYEMPRKLPCFPYDPCPTIILGVYRVAPSKYLPPKKKMKTGKVRQRHRIVPFEKAQFWSKCRISGRVLRQGELDVGGCRQKQKASLGLEGKPYCRRNPSFHRETRSYSHQSF